MTLILNSQAWVRLPTIHSERGWAKKQFYGPKCEGTRSSANVWCQEFVRSRILNSLSVWSAMCAHFLIPAGSYFK